MKEYPRSAWERAMKVEEVILKAISGELTWIQAAEILGMSARNMRRLKIKFRKHGYDGLLDRRCGSPSPKRAPVEDVQKVLQLYREKYFGFNVRHYSQKLQREHGLDYSYTFIKKALHESGLVQRRKKRGKHRLRREPKPCFGQMLHIDGSRHSWLALKPELKQVLILVLDDATSKMLYGQLWSGETVEGVMKALWYVAEQYGLPMSLYSDRAGWAFNTPKAGGKIDRENLTQVGRALSVLGIEHIAAYSPQARGRSERANRTHQDRLVNELRVEGITKVEDANRYIEQKYMKEHNELYARTPKDPANVFVSARGVDLNQVFCAEEIRTVAKDNTVVLDRVPMQLPKQKGVVSCAGWKVVVRRHLDGSHTVWRGLNKLGVFDAEGQPIGTEVKRRRLKTPLRATPSAESSYMWLN